jgi:hypothetical protein
VQAIDFRKFEFFNLSSREERDFYHIVFYTLDSAMDDDVPIFLVFY